MASFVTPKTGAARQSKYRANVIAQGVAHTGWTRVTDRNLPEEEKKQKARQRAKEWYADNRERAVTTAKKLYEKNRQDPEWMATVSAKQKLKNKELRSIVMSHYGEQCACCAEKEKAFLTLDHIDGGGRKHRKLVSGTSPVAYWNWFIKNGFPAGFQALCMNCNFAKGSGGACPHQTKGQA